MAFSVLKGGVCSQRWVLGIHPTQQGSSPPSLQFEVLIDLVIARGQIGVLTSEGCKQ